MRSAAAQVLCAGGPFAEIGRHAAEGALIDFAILGAAERHSVMLKLVDGSRSVAAQILDGVLVAEPVGPLYGVIHVPAPVVPAHIAESRGDAALCGYGVRPGWKNLRDARRLEPRLRAAKGRAKPGAARPYHHDIKGVRLYRSRHGRSHRGAAPFFPFGARSTSVTSAMSYIPR